MQVLWNEKFNVKCKRIKRTIKLAVIFTIDTHRNKILVSCSMRTLFNKQKSTLDFKGAICNKEQNKQGRIILFFE